MGSASAMTSKDGGVATEVAPNLGGDAMVGSSGDISLDEAGDAAISPGNKTNLGKISRTSHALPVDAEEREIRRESPADDEGISRYQCFNEVLGEGTFKYVYKAMDIEEAHEVAWNELKTRHFNKKAVYKFEEELKILRMLRHKNILNYYDAWTTRDSEKMHSCVFITELMTSGTLKQHLRKLKTNVNPTMMKKWCSQILGGLRYLHTRNPPVIHRDVKCDNIFIHGSTSEIKIGDLGLATVKFKDHAESVIGTPEFMAPEMYDEIYTEMVDIYAFGMCVLEMVTKKYPYSECSNAGQVFRKVTKGELPDSLVHLSEGKTKDLILTCVMKEAGADRPSADALLGHSFFGTKEDSDERENGMRSSVENVIEFRNPSQTASHKVGFLKIVLKKKSDSDVYQLNTDVNVMNKGLLKRVRVSTAYDSNENSEELANEMISDQFLPHEDRVVFLDAMDKGRREMERLLGSVSHNGTGFSSRELPIKPNGHEFQRISVLGSEVGHAGSPSMADSLMSLTGSDSDDHSPESQDSPTGMDDAKAMADLKAKMSRLENSDSGKATKVQEQNSQGSRNSANDSVEDITDLPNKSPPSTVSNLPDKMFATLDDFVLQSSIGLQKNSSTTNIASR